MFKESEMLESIKKSIYLIIKKPNTFIIIIESRIQNIEFKLHLKEATPQLLLLINALIRKCSFHSHFYQIGYFHFLSKTLWKCLEMFFKKCNNFYSKLACMKWSEVLRLQYLKYMYNIFKYFKIREFYVRFVFYK